MNIQEIEKAIAAFVRENLIAESVELKVDTALSAIGLDSFSLIEIVLFLERQFDIELPDEALSPENIKSVASFAKCAEKYAEAK
ncbi:UNVERIFIED_CONTAM: hypothetical protein GTU68_029061 [Idotea baltica]|nr:hypothetical protein [Idotea baltica]